MIVKNEEALLGRCLESVKGFDEIVICDTGSEDRTVEIARKFTDKVYTDYKWEDSFCKARNHAQGKVSKDMDWIFTIDADEYLIDSCGRVREILGGVGDNVPVINIVVKAEKSGQTHNFPRIYRNKPEIFWVNDVHNILNKTSKVYTDITTVYGYSPAHLKDPDRSLRILEKSLKEDPTKVREKYYLAREYYYRKRCQDAIDLFKKYVKESKFIGERNDAWIMMARCYSTLGKPVEACDSAWEALKYNANFKEALYFIGDHMDPVNKQRWYSFAKLADNSNVLFKRDREDSNDKVVYYCDGMKFFGDRMVKYMGFKRYDPIIDIDKKVFFEGLYFDKDYDVFEKHKGKRVVYWNGSDVLRLQSNPKWQKILLSKEARHLCQSKWHLPILKDMGINAEYYPIFFGDLNKYQVSFKPSKTPHVYMNCHQDREKDYGVDIVRKIASKVLDITFHIYGCTGEDLPNLKYHGVVEEEVMDKEIKEFQGCIKGGSDGISQVLTKCIFMGQYPISYKEIDGVWYAPTEKELVTQLNRLKRQTKPNIKLRERYKNYYKTYEH